MSDGNIRTKVDTEDAFRSAAAKRTQTFSPLISPAPFGRYQISPYPNDPKSIHLDVELRGAPGLTNDDAMIGVKKLTDALQQRGIKVSVGDPGGNMAIKDAEVKAPALGNMHYTSANNLSQKEYREGRIIVLGIEAGDKDPAAAMRQIQDAYRDVVVEQNAKFLTPPPLPGPLMNR